jgi:pseudomonalisin
MSLAATISILKRVTSVVVLLTVASSLAGAQTLNDTDRVSLAGNVSPLATARNDLGLADPSIRMERMILLLKVRSGTEKALESLLAQQHDPSSPNYQHWLTPAEYGYRFGASDTEISAASKWLLERGFIIDEIAPGRGWMNFSGSVAQVEQAFRTQIHNYAVGLDVYQANSTEPSIPRSLAAIVHGVVSLNNFPLKPLHVLNGKINPGTTFTDGSHGLAPADFATIYNVKPLYSAGITGLNQTIAIVARTDINVSDVHQFRSFFGLPTKDPVIVHNGTAPGDLGGGEEIEALLDTEWSGGVAKNATVKVIISKSTASTDGVDLSAQYIVSHNLASVMSTSFGLCEQLLGSTRNSFWNNLWKQAATQGITSFVSAGDSGAAGCDSPSASLGTKRAVNGLSSTPFNVSVGGTLFNDKSNPSFYWSSTNNASTKQSVLKYIPEVVWNESGLTSGGSGLLATGGGTSTIYGKPTFQTGPGVPTTVTKRMIPDVSLSAALHDGYIVVRGGQCCFVVGGTSASSPSFAGLMSLVVQKTGKRWGNANTVLYPMAKFQYTGGTTAVFHDIRTGNNSVPGITGFGATTAYDRATGLGTVNAANMVNKWNITH